MTDLNDIDDIVSLKNQLHDDDVIQIFELNDPDASFGYIQKEWLGYQVVIPPGFVFVQGCGVEYRVLNDSAVSENNGMKRHFIKSKKKEVNYLYKCKEKFNIRVKIACVVDIRSSMKETNQYQKFNSYKQYMNIDINNSLVQVQHINYVVQYGNDIKKNDWLAWNVRAAAIDDYIQYSGNNNGELDFEITIWLKNLNKLINFFNVINSTDINTVYANIAKGLILDLASLHSIKCVYNENEDLISLHDDIRSQLISQLNSKLQERWGVFEVIRMVCLPKTSGNHEMMTKIKVTLGDFREKIREVVTSWQETYAPILREIRDLSESADASRQDYIIKVFQIYVEHYDHAVKAGIMPVPINDFLRSMGLPSSSDANTHPHNSVPQISNQMSGELLPDCDEEP